MRWSNAGGRVGEDLSEGGDGRAEVLGVVE